MTAAPWEWKTFCPAFKNKWNTFFHAPADLRVVGLLRMAYATVILINAVALYPYLQFWFGEAGVLPTAIAEKIHDPQQLSLFRWLPATDFVLYTGYSLFVMHAVLLLLGIFPRINAVGTFVWLISFQHRAQFLWDGEDHVMRLVGFYLLFMPLQYAGCWPWNFRKSTVLPSEPPSGWAIRLLQLQMCIIYLDTAGSKLHGSMWQDGTALYYVARLDDWFCSDWVPHFLFDTPWIVKLMTWSVLLAEFAVPIFVWFKETRRPALLVALLFHLGCMWMMNLFLFHPIMLCGWMAFLTREDLDDISRCFYRWRPSTSSLQSADAKKTPAAG